MLTDMTQQVICKAKNTSLQTYCVTTTAWLSIHCNHAQRNKTQAFQLILRTLNYDGNIDAERHERTNVTRKAPHRGTGRW
jgi:hypothetical protein